MHSALFRYAITKMENKHPDLLPTDHAIAPIGVRMDPNILHPKKMVDYLDNHIAQLAEKPSIATISKLLNFVDNPNVNIRRKLCKHIVELSQNVSDRKQQELLKEGLSLLQKDKNPIIRLYLAQLTRK